MSDPVMNYAASLATAAGSGPSTNIAAAAHFYQQQVRFSFNYTSVKLKNCGYIIDKGGIACIMCDEYI